LLFHHLLKGVMSVETSQDVHALMVAWRHDGHTAMLLGAARHLYQSAIFDGAVVFIFQPNEEEGRGAAAMIVDSLFDRFPVDSVYGMHNMPGAPGGVGPVTVAILMRNSIIATTRQKEHYEARFGTDPMGTHIPKIAQSA
jgi:metal-dependent amidase/aminoacylase/carboxypeptidase family protein